MKAQEGTEASARLEALFARVRACRICRDRPEAGKPCLPHEPRPVIQASVNAPICIVGQAPGIRVHQTGKPFNDPSGVRLRQWLDMDESVFYDPSRVALIPMGFCFPGYNKAKSDLPPRPECRTNWHDAIFERLPNIRLLIVLGAAAIHYHIGPEAAKAGVNATVANWRGHYRLGAGEFGDRYNPDLRRFALPHPSWRNSGWLNRNPWFQDDVLPVLRRDVQCALLGRPLDELPKLTRLPALR